jgi:Tfp pilus assembly protein PilV
MILRHRGMSYVEVVISVLVLGLAVVAALNAFAGFARGSMSDGGTAIATELAAQLAAEIRAKVFEDPGATVLFGPEPGEANGTRANFDDVDDYNNWSASPPQRRDGTAMAEYQGYTQQVAVELYGANDLKKITVTIKKNGQTLAEIALLRSRNDAEMP